MTQKKRQPLLAWETLFHDLDGLITTSNSLLRTKISGGWVVTSNPVTGVTFVPDSEHKWDGSSLK